MGEAGDKRDLHDARASRARLLQGLLWLSLAAVVAAIALQKIRTFDYWWHLRIGRWIAENGAVVPLAIVSAIPGTESIAILVEKNPNVLAAMFTLPEGTLPEIQARVKMAETCNVYALVRAGGRNFYTAKEIKVTLGGCGG